MSYKKVTNFNLNKENPFLEETLKHVDKGNKTILLGNAQNDILIDSKTGEMKGHSVFAKKVQVDRAEFRKIYVKNLAALFDLSKSGIKIFAFIVGAVKPNKDSLYFDFDNCMVFTGYKSKKTILSGIAELLENGFIARGKNPYHYFINPTIFFNGDRISFLNHYELKEDSKNLDQESKEDPGLIE